MHKVIKEFLIYRHLLVRIYEQAGTYDNPDGIT